MNSNKVQLARRLIIRLPKGQSCFLWGARQTGKSSFLRKHFSKAIRYDLLETDLFLSLLKAPHRFREEILQRAPTSAELPIVIDEVQKVPMLLDEVHWLMENKGVNFILCGSSARKLKRGHANLLGGRAWRYEMFPLTYPEIPNFNLLQALNRGLLPRHYLDTSYKKSIKAYVNDYLKEEIRAEGLTRNLPAFSRFLDSVAYSDGELVVFKNIASDVGVDSKTIREYYEILVDTHMGYFLQPLSRKEGRKTISATPKFYLFDTGVSNHLSKNKIESLRGSAAGKRFEQWVLMELFAYRSYSEQDFSIHFWRTKTDLEVDFVINRDEIYIETKISQNIKPKDLRGLRALIEEKKPRRAIVVCLESRARQVKLKDNALPIEIMPWQRFIQELWKGKIQQAT